MSEIIAILFSVILAENLVFSQAIGTTMMCFRVNSFKDLLYVACFYLPTTAVSAFLCFFVEKYIQNTSFSSLFLFVSFIIIGIVIWLALTYFVPRLFKDEAYHFTYKSMWLFLCIAYVVLRSRYMELTLINTMLYVLGSAIGLCLGGIFLLSVWPRLSGKIPTHLRGLPIRLLTTSLVGMIFVLFLD